MRRRLALLAPLVVVAACELEEVSVVDVEDVVIAEVHVQVSSQESLQLGGTTVRAFLHRTIDRGGEGGVPGASLILTRAAGATLELGETDLERCAATTPLEGTGSCYWLPPDVARDIAPGEALDLTIGLSGGGTLRGSTVVPGDFRLVGIREALVCRLSPDTPMTVRWTTSAGAWAYVNETSVSGLRAALAGRGIAVEEDPLYLLGLSVSASDTTIVFPGEFGVFNRFELDRDLATSLQKGLPVGTQAVVMISAADRNYVNWARGGNFNPSGQVRVPSLRGDGTGVFASTVTRTFGVSVLDSTSSSGVQCPT